MHKQPNRWSSNGRDMAGTEQQPEVSICVQSKAEAFDGFLLQDQGHIYLCAWERARDCEQIHVT